MAVFKMTVGKVRGLKQRSTKMACSCFIINLEFKKAHNSKKYFKTRIIIMHVIFGRYAASLHWFTP